jgi:hypothetical protein
LDQNHLISFALTAEMSGYFKKTVSVSESMFYFGSTHVISVLECGQLPMGKWPSLFLVPSGSERNPRAGAALM